ncbi:hypothetical protein B0A48_12962 [Cryoendolithus antarcticus]|uniref:Pyridoxamine 5'-phosphate oxidase putative domain-containing protein n=1 Tax=Cryoendolithus antarcticus TaxID=1507870 RepID=A0A1V8SQG0_9PEZI|nr:hypothetical protein B0A48_12962 [Cryoendolithus antarcticus]
MGQFYEEIPKSMIPWIKAQKMFWVASAPLSGKGHVNVSPKGGDDYFGVLDTKTFWYHELTGSGNETVSHIYEPGNNRVTILMNAFEGPPRIMRLFGHGRVLEASTPAFEAFVKEHKIDCIPGTRSIILIDIHQVGTSCGFSVPYYDFKEHRPILNDFFKKKAEKEAAGNKAESLPKYWASKNAWSMDGLPGTHNAQKTMKSDGITPLKKMVGPLAPTAYGGPGTRHAFRDMLLAAVMGALFAVLALQTLAALAPTVGALRELALANRSTDRPKLFFDDQTA